MGKKFYLFKCPSACIVKLALSRLCNLLIDRLLRSEDMFSID